MATFTWNAGTSGDWTTISDWTPTTGAPPGALTTDQDQAVFNNTHTGRPTSYRVSVATGETLDLASISLNTSHGRHASPAITISGSLLTDELAYGGHHATSITINPGGLLDIRNEISNSGATRQTITIDASNSGAVGSGGLLEFGSTTVDDPRATYRFHNLSTASLNTGEIDFLSGFAPGITTTQHISNVAQGDEFVFAHADFTGDTVTISDNGDLTVTDANGVTVLTMKNVSMAPGAAHAFQAMGDAIVASAPCYVAGTCILTPLGEVPVEDLAIGDLVVTRSGKAEPIMWIGRRGYEGRFIAANREVLPICIGAGAIADGIPKRDLYVSPGHAMLIDDVLVPAEKLVNGITIRQFDAVDTVEYIHIELRAHDIIFAEGALAETFVDCDNRGRFNNAHEFSNLYPDHEAPKWA